MENTQEKAPPEVITSDTGNATKVHPSDAPESKREKFRKFRAYNTGMWNGPKRENKEQVRRQDNLHRYDSISTSLNLTNWQKKRGRTILDELDIKDIGIGVDAIIFGICVLVANADVRDGGRYYPNPEAAGDVDFEKVADVIDIGRSSQLSAIEKVRSRVDI